MHLRKLRLLVLLLPILAMGRIQAQEPEPSGQPPQAGMPPGPPPTAAQELARLDQKLALSDAQKTALLPILEKRHSDMAALRHSASDRDASRQQMHTIVESTNRQIRALLTEPQQKLFDNMRQSRGPRPGGRPDGPAPSEGPPSPEGGAPPQER